MKRYLLASDFGQTLSFNDSGIVLSDLLGLSGFQERIAGLSRIHLVQQGAELAYLLLHDPEYRRVRQEHLVEVGKRIRVKQNLHLLTRLLSELDGYEFAKRSVLSDDAVSVLVPILEDIVRMDERGIHALFESHGLVLQEWDKVQTDLLTIRETDSAPPLVA